MTMLPHWTLVSHVTVMNMFLKKGRDPADVGGNTSRTPAHHLTNSNSMILD